MAQVASGSAAPRSPNSGSGATGSRSPRRPLAKSLTLREGQRGATRWCREQGEGGAEPADRSSSLLGSVSLRRRGLRESLLSYAGGTLPLAGLWMAAAPGKEEEEEGAAWLALDPAEHEWMLTAAEGNYEALEERLRADPSLLSRRDFVTGYSAVHWIAKHGRHEDLIRLLAFAQSCGRALDVNAPARGGLTPLHLAAMQGHDLLLKLLIGAFGADVHRRDHSGRQAWQYLRADAPPELRELAGAPEKEEPVPRGRSVTLATLNSNNNNCPRGSGPPTTLRTIVGRALAVLRLW
ncbi:ankyrin repeat domain-containing protein SOWAHD [Microcaecilia unicolor]|uniref:Ankyrin repeat domain-containing protein SOWAHD n=1 Tax=Microcaecilia unicolor TaxID=1415580 RepID=A0A6P7YNC2_9AMPH|nr:ankyrin repeat domain-containing protein SOWAHD [Microcaecilia unicolor]XP_030066251.1 ankyrin repeat domain-containing protein SOWAHD [Microcaecilia unicolor]